MAPSVYTPSTSKTFDGRALRPDYKSASAGADDVDEYPVSSPVESDCFGDSESEPDARFATYTGAISVYGEFRDRRSPRQVFLRRNLSYHVERASAGSRDERGSARARGAAARERELAEKYETTYEYDRCTTRVRVRGYGCNMCKCVCVGLRGLMTHLRASHDLFRYSARREGRRAIVRIYPKGENFTADRSFVLRSQTDIQTANDKEFSFYRGKRSKREVFRERVTKAELDALYERDVRAAPPPRVVWRAVPNDDHYDRVKLEKRKRAQEEERRRIAALPFKPMVCKKNANGAASAAATKPKPKPPKKPLGPFYNSRSFVEMSEIPEQDSDDENLIPVEIMESKRFMEEFVDFSTEELSFMEAWNDVAMKFRCVADYEAPSLCEAFVRVHGDKLKVSDEFFKMFVLTLFGMYENGILNRRAVAEALGKCKSLSGASAFDRVSTSVTDREHCSVALFEKFPKFVTTLKNLSY